MSVPSSSSNTFRRDPQAIVDSMEHHASAKKQPTLRRSWYSLTFSDSEDDGKQPIDLALPAASCEQEDALDSLSQASTDVGSDDEDARRDHVTHSNCEYLRRSQLVAEEREQQIQTAPQKQGVASSSEAAAKTSGNFEDDEAVAMAYRRLLKKQRQRQERKELRRKERAERSAQNQLLRSSAGAAKITR